VPCAPILDENGLLLEKPVVHVFDGGQIMLCPISKETGKPEKL
jgi:hypothetical protein